MTQQFHGPVEQVAANDIHNHHHWPEAQPPDDPEVSTQCPQCHRLSWRYSRHCIHCRLDLFAWYGKERQVRAKGWLMRFGFGVAGGAATLALGGMLASHSVQPFVFAGAALLAMLAVKSLDAATR